MFWGHDPRFSEAFANTRHRVYGKRLLPFCLWHQLVLEHAQSPVLAGAPCTPADLLLAARICATPWNPAFVFPDLTLPGAGSLLWHSLGRTFHGELAKFVTYMNDFASPPKLWDSPQGATQERDVDSIIETAAYIVKATTLTWEQAWTTPVGVLSWLSVCEQKLEGGEIQVFTPADEAAKAKFVAQRDAKLAKQAKEKAEAEGISYEQAHKAVVAEYWANVHKSKAQIAAKAKADAAAK